MSQQCISEKIFGERPKNPLHQTSFLTVKAVENFLPKMKVLSAWPSPLSNMTNFSLASDRWYWRGSSETYSVLAGLGSCLLCCLYNSIFLLIWRRAGKLIAAASDIPPSSLPNITWAWFSVALLLIFSQWCVGVIVNSFQKIHCLI